MKNPQIALDMDKISHSKIENVYKNYSVALGINNNYYNGTWGANDEFYTSNTHISSVFNNNYGEIDVNLNLYNNDTCRNVNKKNNKNLSNDANNSLVMNKKT